MLRRVGERGRHGSKDKMKDELRDSELLSTLFCYGIYIRSRINVRTYIDTYVPYTQNILSLHSSFPHLLACIDNNDGNVHVSPKETKAIGKSDPEHFFIDQ